MRTLLAVLAFWLLGTAWADEPPPKTKPPYERFLRGDDEKTAAALEKKLAGLEAAQKYAEAVNVAEELAALRARVQGPDHWQAHDARNHVRTLQRVATLSTNERGELLKAYKAIWQAEDYRLKGKYADAQPLFERALATFRQTLGEQHPHTAGAYNNLAANLRLQGKYADAQPLQEKALASCRQILGEKHPHTASAYSNLGGVLEKQGQYAAAQPLYEKALASLRHVLGDEHPDTAVGYNNLALNLHNQGKYVAAQPLYEKALATWRQALGEAAPLTATAYNNLAMNLNFQGKYADAQPFYEKALAIRRQALGEVHPDTAQSYNNLALNLNAQQKYAAAQPLYEKDLAITRQALGEAHPDTAQGYGNLAANLDAQGQYAAAQPLHEKALAIRRQILGEAHPDTAQSYNNLAHDLDAQGKHADAQPLREKTLAIRRQALGEAHPDTVHGYNNLAANLIDQGKYADALAILDQAVRSYEYSRLAAARGLERAVATGLGSPYPYKAVVLARLGRPREAWEALHFDLARGLLDEQAGRRDHVLQPDERHRQTTLSQRLAVIRPRILYLLTQPQRSQAEQKELDALTGEWRQLDADLAQLAAVRSQREVAALDDVRKALPTDAALVAWIDHSGLGTDEHWACVLRPTGDPVWERLPGTGPARRWTKQDAALPHRLHFALVGDQTTAPASTAEVAAIARELHAQRLAPLEKHLQGVKRLYVVPISTMVGVPVEVLSERYRVSYVPSGTFLARLKDRPRPTGNRVLALGDPRFDADKATPPPAPLPPGGLLVTQVLPNGNAASARIAPNDVLLTYAGADLQSAEQLPKLIADQAGAKTVPVTVWRDGQTAVRNMAPGKLGVVLAKDPAPQALKNKREIDRLLAALRRGAWKELPGTRVELARLTQLFGKDQLTVLADAGATEPALEALRRADRLREYRYLHFATHGQANDVQVLESRLVLTQDAAAQAALPRSGQPTLDGQLTAREVLDFWQLDAELVTLSACETALGRVGGGDGLLGFAQAFLLAGSRAVCLSLWKVDDTATALLMDRFYQNLTGKRAGLSGPLGKAEALAEAKRWLRTLALAEATQRLGVITHGVPRGKGQPALKVAAPPADAQTDPKEVKPFAHPKYWAAFILIGDPD